MTVEVVSSRTFAIAREDDVILVRGYVRTLAVKVGLGRFAVTAVTTATSELARNVLVHGRGGEAVAEEVADGPRRGVRVRCRDQGPGIGDLERALGGGHSSTGSLGMGLAGSRRLVDDFDVDTAPGRGTSITIVKWKRPG